MKKSRKIVKRIALVSQYFPPDFAATGQLLDDLTKRLARLNYKFDIITGEPSYAFTCKKYTKKESQYNREIRRSFSSRIFKNNFLGRLANGLIFCIYAIIELHKRKKKYGLVILQLNLLF